MKKMFLPALFLFVLVSCSSSNGWSDAEKDVFVKNCIPGAQQSAGLSADKAKDYCDCMLDKVEKKYPDATKATSFTAEEAAEMAKECTVK